MNRYQNQLQSMKVSELVFYYVHLSHYKYHKINPNDDGSYIDSPDLIKIKKSTKNLVNKKITNVFNTL